MSNILEKRITFTPNNKCAIFVIHGFTGNINDNNYLFNHAEYLVKPYDIYSFSLIGHLDKQSSHIHKDDWYNQVKKEFEKLINKGYEEIIVKGESMGGTLASIIASEYQEYVSACILTAPATDWFRMEDLNLMAKRCTDLVGIACHKNNIEVSKLKPFTPSSIKEFLRLTKVHKDAINHINCPTLIMHGDKDTLVPLRFSEETFNKNQNINFVKLNGADHWLTKHRATEFEIMNEFIKTNLTKQRTKKFKPVS